MPRHAAVIGVGLTPATSPKRQMSSTLELCRQAVSAALAHAGVSARTLDAVVVGNIDGFEGTVLAGKHQSRSLGLGHDLPVTIVNTGGTTGGNLLQIATRMVRAGTHRRVLCLGGPTFFGARDLQSAINTNSPMVIEQPLGMGGFHMGAFAASAYQERYAVTSEDLACVAVADHDKASRNPYAHLRSPVTVADVLSARLLSTPLTQAMVCPVSASAVALLVSDAIDRAGVRTTPALIAAIGTSSDPYLGGGKGDFARLQSLENLAGRVYALAGVREPLGEIDVVEVFAPYVHMQPMQLEALGFAHSGHGVDLIRSGDTHLGGQLPTNLSGGPKCTNAGVAGELAPFAYTALQVMGDAPEAMQVRDARTGLAHCTGGTFFQFENLAVLRRLTRENA
jgi:acetyl-CoA C-acetyltransferase